MRTRRLGNSGMTVSILGLGTWAMGGAVQSWGYVDDNESIAAINTAIDAGVTLFDTSPIYGDGHAETILGQAIRTRRDDVTIATKCGILRTADGQRERCLTAESIIRECDQSLRRLGIECIDLYQCHWPDPQTPERETFEALESLKKEGKIRAIGVSNYSCEQILHAAEYARLVSVQSPASLLHRRAVNDLLPFAQDHDLAFLAYSPLAKGLLTGKFSATSELSGVRRTDPDFQGQRYTRNLRLVAKVATIATCYGKSPAQLALRWVMERKGVTSAIMGAKRPSQVLENVNCLDFEIAAEDLLVLDALPEMD